MKNNTKKYRKIKYIPIYFFFIGCLLTVVILCNRNSTKSFNHDKWISALENESWSSRKKMAQYLIDIKR